MTSHSATELRESQLQARLCSKYVLASDVYIHITQLRIYSEQGLCHVRATIMLVVCMRPILVDISLNA